MDLGAGPKRERLLVPLDDRAMPRWLSAVDEARLHGARVRLEAG